MKVVAIVGAAVIALAVVGLAVDLERGPPRERTLEPFAHVFAAHANYHEVVQSTGPSPVCIPSCTTVERTVFVGLSELPPMPAIALDAAMPDGSIWVLELDDGVWGARGEATEDWRGDPITFRLGGQPFLQWEIGRSGPTSAFLVPGHGNATLEQIGAVEISALIDARLDAAVPAGARLVAWFGTTPIAFEDGVIDERIERLSIEQPFIVTLEVAGPLPSQPGLQVFTAVPIA